MHLLSDKPERPVLTSNVKEPFIGDSITLTCASTTEGVDGYKFYKGQAPLTSTGTSNTFTISSAKLETPLPEYHCVALIGSIASERSANVTLQGNVLFSRLTRSNH